MEVDSDTLPQILGPAFTITPTVASSPPQQDGTDELDDILWSVLFEKAGDDLKKRERVFARILSTLNSKLNLDDAVKVIESLDEKGLKEWQDGVKAGIEKRDWAILASHRTFRVVPYLEV